MDKHFDQYWQAVLNRDSNRDGQFFYGVLTTGVYCRPSCAARTPLRKNVRFYASQEAARENGLRPCIRCQPDANIDTRHNLMHEICRYIEKHYQQRLTLALFAEQAGMSPSHFQRSFNSVLFLSPTHYLYFCLLMLFKYCLKIHLTPYVNITQAIHSSFY